VHEATLKDGRAVCVKVQYPEASRLFQQDMSTIRTFFNVVAPEQLFMLEALEKQNALELDYMVEANNLVMVTTNMKGHGFMPKEVAVPQPVPELCTKRMLVMEKLPGPKLVDGLRRYGSIVAAKQGKTLEQLEQEARAKIEAGQLPGRYEGPSARSIAIYLAYQRLIDRCLNVPDGVQTFRPSISFHIRSDCD